MKKQLLITLGLLPAFAFAQQPNQNLKVSHQVPELISAKTIGMETSSGNYTPGDFSNSSFYKKHPGYPSILIGNTFYDLQTNASMGRRILLHDDGKVSAVWTTAAVGQAEWPVRGTGYNHKGTNWMAPVSARIETERTGWPNIGILESNGTKYEITMAHVASTGGWILSKNDAIGSNNWTQVSHALLQQNNKSAIWGRMGTNNKNIIHLVSNYWESATSGIPTHYINGVASPTTYSRSTDNGATWDKQFIALPGYDSTRYISGGGDAYAIDVKDSMVAIVMGGLGRDIVLYKSMNNGDSFTKIDVLPFKSSPVTKSLIDPANREECADGSFDILIGNDNKVHIFWGRSYIADEDITDEGYSFYPATAQLMHWVEGADSAIVCGVAKDYDNDNTLTIQRETYSALDASGNLTDQTLISATRYGSTSLVSFPSASTDANGNLYVVYSAPHELALSPFNANYRDLYVSFSTDGGKTWTIGQNITASASGVLENKENVFASVAKRADNFLHIVYQEDKLPGTNLQNNGVLNAHPNNIQNIMYKAVPVQDILANSIGDIVSVKKVTVDPKIFFVSQNQPNPATSETVTYLYMRDGSDITLTVTDIAGKVIRTENLGYYGAGNHAINIQADDLNSGLYLYTISNEKYSITKKMQVK